MPNSILKLTKRNFLDTSYLKASYRDKKVLKISNLFTDNVNITAEKLSLMALKCLLSLRASDA